jgi:hypothetical protein
MFARISRMQAEPSSVDERQPEHMVSVVSGSAGFHHGYWARNVDDPGVIHSVILYDAWITRARSRTASART